uniref:Uncharacterized protein n=1 Tax=Kalanchoe fedtschenkoi TaxID=63787 RepID=A0A7N0UNP5_KALFE
MWPCLVYYVSIIAFMVSEPSTPAMSMYMATSVFFDYFGPSNFREAYLTQFSGFKDTIYWQCME